MEVPYEGLSPKEQLEMTASEIRKGTETLYEAAFSYNNVFMKADILHKGKRGWELYEVKATTELKDVHVNDVALQYHVLTGAGIAVSRAFVIEGNVHKENDRAPPVFLERPDISNWPGVFRA